MSFSDNEDNTDLESEDIAKLIMDSKKQLQNQYEIFDILHNCYLIFTPHYFTIYVIYYLPISFFGGVHHGWHQGYRQSGRRFPRDRFKRTQWQG